MRTETFTLNGDYIELIKLLKLVGIAESGSHAKFLVDENEVKLNGENEFRKRAKLRVGDVVEVLGRRIEIVV